MSTLIFINLLFDPSTQVPPIRGNRLSLIEIFNNLISNAIKYNQPGGWVQIELHESERMVWTQIRDNGKRDLNTKFLFDPAYPGDVTVIAVYA